MLPEKVTFEEDLTLAEKPDTMWGKSFLGKGSASTNVLRQVHTGVFKGQQRSQTSGRERIEERMEADKVRMGLIDLRKCCLYSG